MDEKIEKIKQLEQKLELANKNVFLLFDRFSLFCSSCRPPHSDKVLAIAPFSKFKPDFAQPICQELNSGISRQACQLSVSMRLRPSNAHNSTHTTLKKNNFLFLEYANCFFQG